MGEVNIYININNKTYEEAENIKNLINTFLSSHPAWSLRGLSFIEDMK